MKIYRLPLFFVITLFAIACNNTPKDATTSGSDSTTSITASIPDAKAFQQTIDGKPTNLYVLKNSNNMQLALTNFGGRFVSLLKCFLLSYRCRRLQTKSSLQHSYHKRYKHDWENLKC